MGPTVSVQGVRVRYRASDLGEGVVETFPEATSFTVEPDNTLVLIYYNGKTDEIVGTVHADRWDSAVIEHDEANAG